MHDGVLRAGGRGVGGWRRSVVTRSHLPGRFGAESGMVSAELAMAVPALVLVTLALAWLVGLGASQAMLGQAAREGARAAARGEGRAAIVHVVHEVVPDARVGVRQSGELVVVSLEVRRAPGSPVLRILARDLRASATAFQELP